MLRRWVTPLTTGSFVLVGSTGVLMFFHVRSGLVSALHEWLGMVLVAAAALHVWINWASMKAHLRRPLGLGIVVLFLVLTVFAPFGFRSGGQGDFVRAAHVVLPAMQRARVDLAAQLAGISVDEACRRLESAGVHGAKPESIIEELARTNGVPAGKALVALFPGEEDGREDKD